MKKILFLLLFISLSFASASEIQEIISNSTNSYIIIFLVFIMSALAYMAGSFFSAPSWIARSKDMLYQGIFSLSIMATFPFIFVIFTSLFTTLFLGGYNIPPNSNMYDISENLLLWNYIYYFVHLLAVTFANLYVLAFFGKTYSVPIANRIVPFDLTVLQSPLLYIINVMVGILSMSIMINGFQLLFLNFVRTALLPFLLPIGLLLRAFPSSMHAGNVLVGVTLAAYIIVPIVYAIDLQILPAVLDVSNNLEDQAGQYRAYSSFALMNNFYNKGVLDNVVVQSSGCEIVNKAKQWMGFGLTTSDELVEFQEMSGTDKCGVSVFDTFDSFFDDISGYAQWTGMAFMGGAMITKGINTLTGIASSVSKRPIHVPIWYRITDSFLTSGALFFILVFFYQILLGVTVSFVILSAILPFLKFTIIILFIREFTYTILGTQVSLGQITRLL